MLSFFKIRTVALYEFKILVRSNLFRIFSFLSIATITTLDFFLFSYKSYPFWTLRCIPASIPYLNVMLLNVYQAVLVIFLVADLWAHEKSMNSTNSIYTRSITNAEYLIGKSLGLFLTCFALTLLILLIAFIFNVVFLDDVPVASICYILYPVIFSIPTLIFIIGLSLLCIVIIKNQALVITILLGYFVSSFFLLRNTFHHVFDFSAYNISLMYSDFIGFGNISTIILHRGIYILLGFGFIFSTILFFKRLPQSRVMNQISLIIAIVCISSAGIFGNMYLSKTSAGRKLRQQMTVVNKQLSYKPRISIIKCSLDLIHQGAEIEVTANIKFKNDTSANIIEYIFSLNPGLEILKVENNKKALNFSHNLHIVKIEPLMPLQPGDIDSLCIHYRGKINEEACYADINETDRDENYKLFIYTIDKRYSFITSNYVLLTHENLWYPAAGIPYGSVFPRAMVRDFINFELNVKTNKKLTVISQGYQKKNSAGEFFFKPETPLPQISLVIGEYEKKSIIVDDVEYNIFVKTGHDYFSQYFTELREQLSKNITELREHFERNLYITYPFKRFSLVEVPVQYYVYNRFWTINTGVVQPEQVFLPEKGFHNFYTDFKDSRRGLLVHETLTPKEIQNSMFRSFCSSFVSGSQQRIREEGKRQLKRQPGISIKKLFITFIGSLQTHYSNSILSNYYNFIINFKSSDYPFFDSVIEQYVITGKSSLKSLYKIPSLPEYELACLHLSKRSLPEIFADPGDLYNAQYVLKLKTDYLFSLINASLGEEEFRSFFSEYLENHKFKTHRCRKLH